MFCRTVRVVLAEREERRGRSQRVEESNPRSQLSTSTARPAWTTTNFIVLQLQFAFEIDYSYKIYQQLESTYILSFAAPQCRPPVASSPPRPPSPRALEAPLLGAQRIHWTLQTCWLPASNSTFL